MIALPTANGYEGLVKQINDFKSQSSEGICKVILQDKSVFVLKGFSVEAPDIFVFDCETDSGIPIKIIQSANQLNVELVWCVDAETTKTSTVKSHRVVSRTLDLYNEHIGQD